MLNIHVLILILRLACLTGNLHHDVPSNLKAIFCLAVSESRLLMPMVPHHKSRPLLCLRRCTIRYNAFICPSGPERSGPESAPSRLSLFHRRTNEKEDRFQILTPPPLPSFSSFFLQGSTNQILYQTKTIWKRDKCRIRSFNDCAGGLLHEPDITGGGCSGWQ